MQKTILQIEHKYTFVLLKWRPIAMEFEDVNLRRLFWSGTNLALAKTHWNLKCSNVM